jgi:hypothetical protein
MAEHTLTYMRTTKLVELLSAAADQGQTFIQINAEGQVVLGADPYHPNITIDFRDEVVRPLRQAILPIAPPLPAATPRHRRSRRDGKYLVDIKGTTTVAHSLHEALGIGLRAFEAHRSGTLDRLEQIKPKTKRIVARNRRDLFEDPDLVENYARQLMPGWWYGINNSNAETSQWLRRGCELAGLTWDKDFSVSL